MSAGRVDEPAITAANDTAHAAARISPQRAHVCMRAYGVEVTEAVLLSEDRHQAVIPAVEPPRSENTALVVHTGATTSIAPVGARLSACAPVSAARMNGDGLQSAGGRKAQATPETLCRHTSRSERGCDANRSTIRGLLHDEQVVAFLDDSDRRAQNGWLQSQSSTASATNPTCHS